MGTASKVLLAVPDSTMVAKIAAAVLAVGSVIQNFFFHPDCSKIATTQIVNQAQQFAQQNLDAWNSLQPSDKTYEAQQAALMNFDNVWAQVVRACARTAAPARRAWPIGSRGRATTRRMASAGTGCRVSQPDRE
jgi:hypothetical protein